MCLMCLMCLKTHEAQTRYPTRLPTQPTFLSFLSCLAIIDVRALDVRALSDCHDMCDACICICICVCLRLRLPVRSCVCAVCGGAVQRACVCRVPRNDGTSCDARPHALYRYALLPTSPRMPTSLIIQASLVIQLISSHPTPHPLYLYVQGAKESW